MWGRRRRGSPGYGSTAESSSVNGNTDKAGTWGQSGRLSVWTTEDRVCQGPIP